MKYMRFDIVSVKDALFLIHTHRRITVENKAYDIYKAFVHHMGPVNRQMLELVFKHVEDTRNDSEESLEIQRNTSLYEIDVNTGEII